MGFGSYDDPYWEPPFSKIVNVHWPQPGGGSTDTMEVVNGTLTVHTGSLLFYHYDSSRGLYVGAGNPSSSTTTLTYSIDVQQIYTVVTGLYESTSASGTLAPGQTFLIAVWQLDQMYLVPGTPDIYFERLSSSSSTGVYIHGLIDITASATLPPP